MAEMTIEELLQKAEEVGKIVESYSAEIADLQQLVAQGKEEYKELLADYEHRLQEFQPQLTTIRHAIFKMREAKRLSNEADQLVSQIKETFKADKERRQTLEQGPVKKTRVKF